MKMWNKQWSGYIIGGLVAVPIGVILLILLAPFFLRDDTYFEIIQTDTDLGAVYYFQDTSRRDTVMRLVYDVGEADMTGPEGLAHYVSHLVYLNAFDGAKDSNLRDVNFWNTKIVTNYFLTTQSPANSLAQLAATIDPITLSLDDMNDEVALVRQEFAKKYNATPDWDLNREFDYARFAGSGLARQSVGDASNPLGLQPDLAKSAHRKTYHLENSRLLVLTPMNKRQLRALINENFSKKKNQTPLQERKIVTEKLKYSGRDQKTLQKPILGLEIHKTSYIAPPAYYSEQENWILVMALSEILNSSRKNMFKRFLIYEKHDYTDLTAEADLLAESLGYEIEFRATASNVNLPYLSSAFDEWIANIDVYRPEIEKIWLELTYALLNPSPNWDVEQEYHAIASQIYQGSKEPVGTKDIAPILENLTVDDVIALLRYIHENSREVSRIWKGGFS